MDFTNEQVYELLKRDATAVKHRVDRWDMLTFAHGYFGECNTQIYDVIDRLCKEGVIDA